VRAGASVVGYEIREDFALHARQNVEAMLGEDVDYRVEIRDVTEAIDERGLDRILLDMPEPWRVLPQAALALRPGGILLAYLPTINQTAELRRALDDAPFGLAETMELLRRTCTWRRDRCAPTTAWWATPAFSPRLGAWSFEHRPEAAARG